MLTTGQHTLITQPDNNDSYKHCILVKLTDSSAKAIEEYIRNSSNINVKPSIIFQKDRGEILFPKANNYQHEESQFKRLHFSLSSVKESNQSASFECISYTNSKLITIGNIEQKLAIQANVEESFKDTKEKLNNVAEEEKKNALIEIKSSGTPVNRNSNMNFNRSKQITPNFSQPNNNKPLANSNTSNIAVNNVDNKLKSDISLRERVVHLLALKPYMKPVLLLKLNKDSPLTEKEKESLESIIQSVATLNQKNSYFELNNDIMLSEVKDDWPYFNEQQQQIVKKNLAKIKLMNNNAGIVSASNSQQKQVNLTASSLSTSNSKNASSAFISINQSASNSYKLNIDNFTSNNDQGRKVSPPKTEGHSKTKASPNNNIKNYKYIAKNMEKSMKGDESPNDSPDSDDLLNESDLIVSSKKSNEKENNQYILSNKRPKTFSDQFSDDDDSNEFTKLSKLYPRIESNKQMEQYRNDFEQMYNEYLESRNYLESISKTFQAHKQEIESIADKTSKEYYEKRKNIFKDYADKTNDKEYLSCKERHDALFIKLNFIQDLIKNYESISS